MKSVSLLVPGISLETRLAPARAGYQVFATMRNLKKVIALEQRIKDESLNTLISAMDVDSDDSVKRMDSE